MRAMGHNPPELCFCGVLEPRSEEINRLIKEVYYLAIEPCNESFSYLVQPSTDYIERLNYVNNNRH
jgi:hypothetical protein